MTIDPNLLFFFNLKKNSTIEKLNENHLIFTKNIEKSDLDYNTKKFFLYILKEKYKIIFNYLKGSNDEDLFWENIDSC